MVNSLQQSLGSIPCAHRPLPVIPLTVEIAEGKGLVFSPTLTTIESELCRLVTMVNTALSNFPKFTPEVLEPTYSEQTAPKIDSSLPGGSVGVGGCMRKWVWVWMWMDVWMCGCVCPRG